jgi:hypothetical protein
MKFFRLIFFILPTIALSLEMQPWFGNTYELSFLGKYAYSRFSSVDSSIPPLANTSNDHLLHFNLEFPVSSALDIDTDLEFTDTPRQSFSFRSYALQTRYLIWDDIVGDILSVDVGANARITSKRSVHDISCPYGNIFDLEGSFALGKEFDQSSWKVRIWGFGALGIANKGSPWIRGALSLEGNISECNKWALYTHAIHGYGRKTIVYIDHFDGYGPMREKNIDIGLKIGHRFNAWGTLSLEYRRRVYAKRCPEGVNTFAIMYLLPFSF